MDITLLKVTDYSNIRVFGFNLVSAIMFHQIFFNTYNFSGGFIVSNNVNEVPLMIDGASDYPYEDRYDEERYSDFRPVRPVRRGKDSYVLDEITKWYGKWNLHTLEPECFNIYHEKHLTDKMKFLF